MSTEAYVEKIIKAKDFAEASRHLNGLKSHLDQSGAPLPDAVSYRIISHLTTLSTGAARTAEAAASGGGNEASNLVETIVKALAAKPRDDIALNQSWKGLDALLADPATQIDEASSAELLDRLKAGRLFHQLAKSAERLVSRGNDSVTTRRLYAQALIDEGYIIPAIDVLDALSRCDALPGKEKAEVQGLLGRAYKQIYVNYVNRATAHKHTGFAAQFAPALQAAIDHYASAYDPSRPADNFWHGGNYLSLLNRAKLDGVSIKANADLPGLARGLANALEPVAQKGEDAWALATLGEAYLTLGENEKAADYFSRHAHHPKIDAFKLGGTIRQLEEVWRLEADIEGAGAILTGLKAIMSQMEAGRITLSSEEQKTIEQHAAAEDGLLQRMLPGAEMIKYRILRTIVQRGAAVCIVRHRYTSRPWGTGFLIDGRSLSSKLGDETYLLTNAHVVSDPNRGRDLMALTPFQACVYFEGADGSHQMTEYTCEPEAVWQSPASEYDATLLRLKTTIPHIKPLKPSESGALVVEDSEAGVGGTRLAVIGHPKGDELSLLLAGDITDTNGTLVDMGPRNSGSERPVYLHYKTPTEPGNSGSPVFETGSWELVGLHHAGFHEQMGRPRLGGKPGSHFANEGICIQSLREAIDKSL
ncbi:MAG: trypsin-like serine protease [Rhodomicrobium sp.]|nr:trypsin-like serine protease [Rhodomicrobium sp.]